MLRKNGKAGIPMTPQEEILMLRALVEKQSAELKKKDEIIIS